MKTVLLFVAAVALISLCIIKFEHHSPQLGGTLAQVPVKERMAALPGEPRLRRPAPLFVRDTKLPRGVKIAGPLKGRALFLKVLPHYPEWAERDGITAEFSAKIWVRPEGDVSELIQVTRMSTEQRLDQLALESLRQWQFAPAPRSKGNQWGIVTFHFKLLYPKPTPQAWPATAQAPIPKLALQVAMQ